MQPHIHLNEGLGIRCAILPGDPARVERIAAYLDDVCDHGSHREYRSISGTWRGVPVLAIVNVVGSTIAKIADYTLYTWAGPEIAVATTKGYTTQLTVLYLFALYAA